MPAVHALADALLRAGRIDEGQKRRKESEQLQTRTVARERVRRTAGMLAAQAEVHMGERRYGSAIAIWQQVIELEGGGATNYLRLAEALTGEGRLMEAAAQIQLAIASRNAGPEAHRRLADVYASLGRADESASARRTYVEQRLRQLGQLDGVAAGFDK
jgi:predicted Zn-dependent protease